jgi:hypothetical protein
MNPRDNDQRGSQDRDPPDASDTNSGAIRGHGGIERAADAGAHEGAADEPRAEEIIVEVYRMLREARARGEEPDRVIMDRETYERLQAYRARLGEAPEGKADYLGRYSLFGLEIFVESDAILEVC